MPSVHRCVPGSLWLLALHLALLPPLATSAPAEPAVPGMIDLLPPPPLRDGWVTAGRPTVVLVPDHLGLDARAAFHAAPLLERGLAVVLLDLPAEPGMELGDRLRPRPREKAEDAPVLLPALFALLARLGEEGLPPEGGPRRVIGLLGFGMGGEAALLVAGAVLPPGAPRFHAHAALYPTCGSPALREGGAAPARGAPILLILPHAGGAGDLPGGCASLFDPQGHPAADPVLLRAYDSLGYGFDLWPATAWQARDAAFDPLRFDALRAELARQDIARFFAQALSAERAVQASHR
jgi:dienelactone hydrolase